MQTDRSAEEQVAHEVHRPTAVAFDVNETLFSMESVRRRMVAEGLPAHALEWWFARTLRDGFALAAMGEYAPFADVAEGALRVVLGRHGIDPAAPGRVAGILSGLEEMEPQPDVEPALRRLGESGLRVATLTVGSASLTDRLLRRCGLRDLVEACFSADSVRAWKPRPEPYHHTAQSLGVPPSELALVAVHAWDVHGASAAGLVAGWAARLEGTFPSRFGHPDVAGASLVDVVDALLALPPAPGSAAPAPPAT